jgi:hypothetical protein
MIPRDTTRGEDGTGTDSTSGSDPTVEFDPTSGSDPAAESDPTAEPDSSDDPGSTTVPNRSPDRDPPAESPSMRVIEAVSEAIDEDPRRMDPLYESIDPDALDRLFEPVSAGTRQSSTGRVTFHFEGCEVTVHADGRTVVTPPDADDGA